MKKGKSKPLNLKNFTYVPEAIKRTNNVLDLPGYAGGAEQSIHLNSVGMAEFLSSGHALLAEVRRLRGQVTSLRAVLAAEHEFLRHGNPVYPSTYLMEKDEPLVDTIATLLKETTA